MKNQTIFFIVIGLVVIGSIAIVGVQIGDDIANVDDFIDGDIVPPDPSRAISCRDLTIPAFPPAGISESSIRGSSLSDARYREQRKNAYSVYLEFPPRDYAQELRDAGWKVYNDEGLLPGIIDLVSAETDLIAFKDNEWLTLRHLVSIRDNVEYSLLMHGGSLVDIEELTWWLDNYEIQGTVVGDSLDSIDFVLANVNKRNVASDLANTCNDHGGVPGYDPDDPRSYTNPITEIVSIGCNGVSSGIGIFGQRDGADIVSFHLEFGSNCNISK